MVAVRDGLQQDVRGEDGDAQPSYAVGLHREPSLVVHSLDDGLDFGTRLHSLVRSQVADVSSSDGKHLLAQQGVLLVHHLLEDGCGIYARQVVIFKCRHEGDGSGGNHQKIGIHIGHFSVFHIFQRQASAFQQIPYGMVQQDAFAVLTGQRLCDVKTAHTAILLFLFKKEELVGLHVELTADAAVVVNHKVGDSKLVQLFTAGQTGRSCPDDGDRGLVNADFPLRIIRAFGLVVFRYFAHFVYIIHFCDADAAHFAVNQHFAGTALADAAFQTAVASVKAVAVHRVSGLMQGGGDGIAFFRFYFLSFKQKFDGFLFRNLQDGVLRNFIHT